MASSALPPTGLLCQLLGTPEKSTIHAVRPQFCWVVNDRLPDASQSAFRILVASKPEFLARESGDLWDSGKCPTSRSLHVPYAGQSLVSQADYYWAVRTWNQRNEVSPWSEPQHFRTGALTGAYTTSRYPLAQSAVAPAEIARKGAGHFFCDFGKAAFGTLKLELAADPDERTLEVHLGEALAARHTLDRTPPGCIRYRKMLLPLKKGTHSYTLEITPDKRNTGPRTIRMPREIGEVMPFRYCELVNLPASEQPPLVRQLLTHYPFDETQSDFKSSDPALNAVWDLCKYSIKATSFCGIYVDGDRERIPYEADAYINQLSHYAVDHEFTLARASHEYLLTNPTSPTEWILHSVLMAWADYAYTGNADSLAHFYEDLKAKTLLALAREDGLISSKTGLVTDAVRRSIHLSAESMALHGDLTDLVDWPPASFTAGTYGERDGYEFMAINTVVNAFHYRALVLMGRIAEVLGKAADAQRFRAAAERVWQAINARLFDPTRKIYLDGEGASHASLHANMFPLAFGLVPAEQRQSVAAFIKSRGMACSVYGAQYLLEALYRNQEADYAFELLTARSDRSWWNMLKVGSTVTLEAWDWKYKNNLDWNHAWGSAPANIIPRFLMGIRPLEPGFGKVLINPQPGQLRQAELTLPTIRGPVRIQFERRPEESFLLQVHLPANMTARALLPLPSSDSAEVVVDGKLTDVVRDGPCAVVDPVGSGRHTLECRPGTSGGKANH